MVHVFVCKNDGCFDFEHAEIKQLNTWSDAKMELAHVLYCEEELFAVGSPADITLYRMPEGENLEIVDSTEANSSPPPLNTIFVQDSRWVLDIFGSDFRKTTDLTIQTDRAIHGMRRTSMTPLGRRTTVRASIFGSPSTAISPFGNDRGSMGDTGTDATYQEPYIHIGTWVPLLVKDKPKPTGKLLHMLKPTTAEYEDVLITTHRARAYINKFRSAGRPVTILSIQTVTLPLAVACPLAISNEGPRVLYEGVYLLNESDAQRGFVQAVRLWFSFDCEQTVSVTKVNGTLGLKPLRQQDGWIVVQALPGSPCYEAGMRDQEVFLTHVNGVDVSPHAFPAVGTSTSGSNRTQQHVSWKDSVVPLVENSETCIFTFF